MTRAVSLARNKDVLGDALVCAVGFITILSVRGCGFNTLGRMGPGFFPTLIGVVMVASGVVMVASGVAIALSGIRASATAGEVANPDLCAWLLIPFSPVAFIVVGEYGGLLPAIFTIVFVAALADCDNTCRHAILLAASLGAVCLVVFW